MTKFMSYQDLASTEHRNAIMDHISAGLRLGNLLSEFCKRTSEITETHRQEIKSICAEFRELTPQVNEDMPRGYYSSLARLWDKFIEEVDLDADLQKEIAHRSQKHIAKPIHEICSTKKIQAGKLFTYWEEFEQMTANAEDELDKHHQDYVECYYWMKNNFSSMREHCLYVNMHNDYILQLVATNMLFEEYNLMTLPQLIEELEDIRKDTANTLKKTIEEHSQFIINQRADTKKRYEELIKASHNVDPGLDVSGFVRIINPTQPGDPKAEVKTFTWKKPVREGDTAPEEDMFDSNLVLNKTTERYLKEKMQELQTEAMRLVTSVRQNHSINLDLVFKSQKMLGNHDFKRYYDYQIELCSRRNEIREGNVRLAAIKSQLEALTDCEKKEKEAKLRAERAQQDSLMNKDDVEVTDDGIWSRITRIFKGKSPPPESK